MTTTTHIPDGLHWTTRKLVDVRVWPGSITPELREWIGQDLITVHGDRLTVHNAEGDPVALPPGWFLVRYPEGLIVHSPSAAVLNIEPEAVDS